MLNDSWMIEGKELINEQMEEYIDLCYEGKKVTVLAKKTGKEGQYLAHCVNPSHEDKDPSMGINVIEGVYNCQSQHDAKGVTWARHLREKGESYKPKSSKKYLQEAEDKEIKSDIFREIEIDIDNWDGYDKIAKEEARRSIPFDLCFIPEDERVIAMGAIVKAGIFKITELRGMVKKALNELKKQKGKVKEEGEEKQKEKGPILKTFLPGLIHLIDDNGVKKYLLKSEDDKLTVAETWTGEGGQTFKPRQDIKIGYASPAVLTLNRDINWASLLKDIERYIKKHLELPGKVYYLVFALWIMHTYLIEETDITPYLYYVGLKGTGKSRAGTIANKLAYKCLLETMPTAPVLFRTSDQWHNALIIDEAKFWGSEMDRDLARIVMSRYKRGVTVLRVNMDKRGEKSIEIYDVFGPLIICTETNIPEPIEDRCIKFQMKRNESLDVEGDWDLPTEQALIDLLTLFRAKFIGKRLPQHVSIARRRLGEILSPLYKILLLVDESRIEEFKEFIKMEKTSRTADEATSENATIISILIDFYNEGKDIVSTQEIAKSYNQDTENPNFQISDRSMGWRIKPFNFEKKPIVSGTHSKAGWVINRNILIKLAERFSVETEIIPVVEHNKKVKEETQLSMPD